MEDLKDHIRKKTGSQQVISSESPNADSLDTAETVKSPVDVLPLSAVPNIDIDMSEAKDRVRQLQDFIKYMMVPGIDFGFIQGCPKPMLFKAGAEKLCDIYGLSKHIEVLAKVEDFEKGIFHYQVKAILINKKTGMIESEGIGCCNNREKKFAAQDPYSVVNSVLKMAKKRAIVDATLAATRTSGIFSQDLENSAA